MLRFRLFLFCLLVFLTSCSDKNTVDNFNPGFEVYVLFPSEGLGDRGFVDAIYEGVEAAELEYSFILHYIVPETLEQGLNWIHQIHQIESSLASGCLVIVAGNQYVEAVDQVDGVFGSNKVLLIGGIAEEHPDLISVDYRMYAPSYISGFLSAGLIPYCRAQAVAGFDAKFTREAIAGFEQGVKDAGGEVSSPAFLSSDFRGFEMPDSAYSLVLNTLDQVDLIFAFSDGSNIGIINAVRDYDKPRFVIGVDANQNWMGANVVTGSVLKHFTLDILEFIGGFSEQSFKNGNYLRTLEDGKCVFFINPALLNPELITDSLINLALSKEQEFRY